VSLTLVTGATGLVGHAIVRSLLARGRRVRVLVRSVDKAKKLLPEACEIAPGDVTDRSSVEHAMYGVEAVYHSAGLPEQWLSDVRTFDRVNVGGTRHMIEAALAAKVKRFIYTSTIDVFRAGAGESYDESVIDPEPKGTHYERSKQEADRTVVAALARGLPAIFLHPSAVYGPGPAGSPGMNDFFVRLHKRQVPLMLPGGTPIVFSNDVGEGHVLAEQKARIGDRFILSDEYRTLREIAERAIASLGMKKVPPVMPLLVGQIVARAGEALSSMIGKPPLVARGQLHFLQWGARPSSKRAERDLGWKKTPFDRGLDETLRALGILTA
jgi:dihydroflavonol-4-reductase